MKSGHFLMLGIGLLIGAGAGYYIAKKEVEKKMWELYYDDHINEVKASKSENDEEESIEETEGAKRVRDVYLGEDVSRYKPNVTSPDLTAGRLDTSVTKKDEVNEKINAVDDEEIDIPQIITIEDFADDENRGFALVNWYPDCKVATDEMDQEEIAEVDDILGMHNLYDIEASGAEVAYIRNGNMNYEVHINRGVPEFMLDPNRETG